MSDTYQIEMLWDCPAGHKRNPGRAKTCETCGRPQTEDQDFYMPDDTSRAAQVTDKKLLSYALAGEDWHCRYCSSSQRRLDGTCEQCGSDQSETVKSEPRSARVTQPKRVEKEKLAPRVATVKSAPPPRPRFEVLEEDRVQQKSVTKWILGIPAAFLLIALFIWALMPKEHDVTVADVYFQHAVHVEKYQIVQDSGWDYPVRAFDVERQGKRIHHHDRVENGWEKEYYDVDVPDGQRCTSYTTPQRCKSNKNGFATCSGGERKRECVTKYRKEKKWRKKTLYKDVPVYREWYAWKIWEWKHDRDVFATGHTLDVYWPSETEIALCRNCTEGEQERVKHDDRYTVKFSDGDDTWNYTPNSLNEFKTFPVGSKRRIKVTLGSVEILPRQ